jgi:DeoR/GlpR family transcriptional regulator of sugar metabolism
MSGSISRVTRRVPRNPAARRAELKRLMLARETVSVETLCALLSASPATIRRDLAALAAEGALERTHGGAAVQVLRFADQNFAQRELEDVEEKRRIAETVIRFIPAHGTIFLNDGSTIVAVAKAIVSSGLDVFAATPAVNVASKLAESSHVTTCLLGGFMRTSSLATTGHFTQSMVAQINADVAIIAPDGISLEAGLTFVDPNDAGLAQRMMEQSRHTIVVATARKLNMCTRVTAAPISKIARMITGADAPIAELAAAGLTITLAEA